MSESRNQIRIEDEVVSLAGALTHNTVEAVYRMTPAFAKPDYEVDLQKVEKVDSAALALLVIWRDRAARNSSNLHFRHVPAKLGEIAQLVNLERILD